MPVQDILQEKNGKLVILWIDFREDIFPVHFYSESESNSLKSIQRVTNFPAFFLPEFLYRQCRNRNRNSLFLFRSPPRYHRLKIFSVFLVFCKFSLYIFSVYSCGQGHDLRVLRYLCVRVIILVFVALTWSRQAQWLNVIGQYLAEDRPNLKRYFKKLTITRVHMIFTRRSFLFSTISMTPWKKRRLVYILSHKKRRKNEN